jgi:hypothetical protein
MDVVPMPTLFPIQVIIFDSVGSLNSKTVIFTTVLLVHGRLGSVLVSVKV